MGGGKTITEVKSVDPRDDDAKHVGLALFVDSNEPEGPHKSKVCKTARKIVTGTQLSLGTLLEGLVNRAVI